MTDATSSLGEWSSCEVRQSERTASRVIEGKAIVITIDQNELHVLNGVGTRVWQLLDGRELAAVVDAIVSEFEVDTERAAADVRRFVEQLFAVGAVQIKQRAAAP
jgi:coenzyme PQQ synthesis protein D (PqqD)